MKILPVAPDTPQNILPALHLFHKVNCNLVHCTCVQQP